MTIWTFGNSFTKHYMKPKSIKNIKDTWIENVSNITNQNVICFSRAGITLEETFDDFYENQDQISNRDIVIISLTELGHRFFSEKFYSHLALYNNKRPRAIDNYPKYLEILLDTKRLHIYNFLYNIDRLSKKKKLHTIVLPSGRDSMVIVQNINQNLEVIQTPNSAMASISYFELKPNFFFPYEADPRVNHLSRDNHLILADKIMNNIKHLDPINLDTEFKKDFLDESLANNKEFIKDQLFNGLITKLRNSENKSKERKKVIRNISDL